MKNRGLLHAIADELESTFGAIDMISPWLPFDFTTYYESEMGPCLSRRVMVFKPLIDQEQLADIKITTNQLERQHTVDGNRQVNLDPGYLVHERFVLATGKNFTHRIYIGRGIYADLTLIYRKGAFETLPWTYPDYAHCSLFLFLERVRKKYVADMKTD